MFNNHVKGVCNALTKNFSNAMAERLNGKIQEIKTVARGYRTFNDFRSAVLFFSRRIKSLPAQIMVEPTIIKIFKQSFVKNPLKMLFLHATKINGCQKKQN
tara:strand:+ start:1126 stop:1428 length:303 start_codon:yes stop_codon:yes gene_type:complete